MKQVNEAKKQANSRFPEHEQLLLVTLKLSDSDMGSDEDTEYVENLEEKLIQKVEALDFAFWDGHEFGGGFAKIFLYTSDVDQLYKALYKTFKNINFTLGSCIVLQYSQTPMEHFVIDPNKLPD
jgi:phage gp16-like protein